MKKAAASATAAATANADGIKNANEGQYSPAMCFIHKPLPEFRLAYNGYLNGQVESIGDVHVHYSCFGSSQNGFFEKVKVKGVSDIICGHQHGNNFTLKYENVRLTFALKTGELGGYYCDDNINLNGGTFFVLQDNLKVDIENIYVSESQFHFKKSNNKIFN